MNVQTPEGYQNPQDVQRQQSQQQAQGYGQAAQNNSRFVQPQAPARNVRPRQQRRI